MAAIRAICARRHVRNLYVFGSILTERFNPESDIGFLVELEDLAPQDYAGNYFDLCGDLESPLSRRVDVVTLKSVRNPYFKESVFKTRRTKSTLPRQIARTLVFFGFKASRFFKIRGHSV